MLQILNTGIQSAEVNMRIDAELLENVDPTGKPILHLYQWSHFAATYGYFIRPETHLNLNHCAKWGLDLARRPTGGGILFHIWDLAFSFIMPSGHPAFSLNTLENYQFVNRAVQETMQAYFGKAASLIPQDGVALDPACAHFCMAKPTQYDVVQGGLKIAGAAQRRRKQGYLHQGTIALARPNYDLLKDVLLSQEVVAAMQTYSFAPLAEVNDQVRTDIQNLLADKLKEALEYYTYDKTKDPHSHYAHSGRKLS